MPATESLQNTPVDYEYDDAEDVARITLSRSDSLNAVTRPLYDGVRAGLDAAAADDARVVVLQGEGRAFCVGADMKGHDEAERTPAEKRAYVEAAQETCLAVQTHPAPVVVKVQGYAIGAGAELALSADCIVMATDAEMRFPEVSIGTYVGGGVTYTLPERVGRAKARELVLTAATVEGTEAGEMGLATEVVPPAALDEAVDDLVDTLASHAPIPMQHAKEQFRREPDRDHLLTAEADALLACMETDDWQEGVDAFAEDREPVFRGE
ncbi:enoyl-CoA hydratase/isomerase family protein [Haloarchaeobius sp. DYHT-AS-18]|uniref:enoyl-CoA hydratase/isomerase family protein n=1 Tax=Haloarchaeobius sp. DYHT-AS-18 TaxID=3446117 RepID=UPI003EBE06B2